MSAVVSPAAAAVPARAGPRREEEDAIFSRNNLMMAGQMVAIYCLAKYVMPQILGTVIKTSPSTGEVVTTEGIVTPAVDVKLELLPLWEAGSLLDMHLQLTTSDAIKFEPTSSNAITWEGIEYGKSNETREWNIDYNVPTSVQQNGSFYLDVFITRASVAPDNIPDAFDINSEPARRGASEVHHFRKMLTRYNVQRKLRVKKNLLATSSLNDTEDMGSLESNETRPIISYYHPNLTLQLVHPVAIAYNTLAPVLQAQITPAHETYYYPTLVANDFWLLNEHMNPLNESTTIVPFSVSFDTSSFMKFQIYSSLDDAFSKQAMGGNEFDQIKRVLSETSPWLLITTFVVSMLHMLFEFLAFTSDISHWRSKKELVGVSLRTIVTNVVVQFIIMLYLLDNNEQTSWVILGGQGMGLAVEAWKITKAVNIRFIPTIAADNTVLPYRLEITDKHVLTADELKTQEYDQLAFKWVTWGVSPFLIGYAMYSFIYNEHRSYYSFLLTTATTCVYMFGFVQLIPQLIINMKLKSVAHMPRKTMIYKFLNTIVDDFSAFIITMPTLHRLAAFRDDVVFVILLWQMYIYRTDLTRANEYGQQLSPEAAAELEKKERELKLKSGALPLAVDEGDEVSRGEEKIESKKDI